MKTLINFIYLIGLISFAQPCDLGFELNGTNDYVTVPNTDNINSNSTAVGTRTIETWFKTDDATPRQVIYEEGAQVNAILLYVEGERVYSGGFRGNGSSSEFFRSASNSILDDTWYHIALVISTSGSTTTFLWYLDGVLQDSQTAFTIPRHTGNISLGRNGGQMRYPNCATWSASSVTGSTSENCTNSMTGSSTTNYNFNGNIWGFRIWNSARTLTEINDNIDSELTSGTNLVAYLDDDNIEYLNSSNAWATASANGNGTTYTWSATASTTDWNTAGNWVGSVPSTTKLQRVVIPSSTNYPSISSEIRIGRLDLSSSSSEITIEDGGTLNVYYDVDNSGTITIENNGSFILQDNEAVSGSGTYVIDRDTPDYPIDDFFSIWSTPVAESDSEIGTIFTNNVIVFEYDASQNPAAYASVSTTADMEVGKGYFVKSDDDSGVLTRTFTGTVNNGNIDETIYFNSATDNFNLIGNPYPSAIDWLSFHDDNSDVLNGTMYFWSQTVTGENNSVSDYISFNSTGSNVPGTTGDIASGQGVFTKSSQAGTVTFKNTHRVVGNNDQFFRNQNNPDEGKSWFKLSGDAGFSSILVGFIPGATNGYESAYDGEFVNEGSPIEFYSFIGGDKYAIQGRAELVENAEQVVPLGFEVTSAGTYTISIFQEYIDPTFDILLDDTQENVLTDLRQSDYTFSLASPTEANDRFVLRYRDAETLGVNDFDLESENLRTFFDDNTLVTIADNADQINEIEIFDITGKQIAKAAFNERMTLNDLATGLYLAKYKFNNDALVVKKVIKY